jgi:hypothetical protein
MRIAVCFPVLALLTACAVVPPEAWTFEPTQPHPKVSVSAPEAAALTDRVAQLQLLRHQIRGDIALERDVWKRQDLYARLHSVGVELSPLERRLGTLVAR